MQTADASAGHFSSSPHLSGSRYQRVPSVQDLGELAAMELPQSNPYQLIPNSKDAHPADANPSNRSVSSSNGQASGHVPHPGGISPSTPEASYDPYDPSHFISIPAVATAKARKKPESYLPYSHDEDSNTLPTTRSIYYDDPVAGIVVDGGAEPQKDYGDESDHMAMSALRSPDISLDASPKQTQVSPMPVPHPMFSKKRRRQRCAYFRKRTCLYITVVFLVVFAVVLFFVCPRAPRRVMLREIEKVENSKLPQKDSPEPQVSMQWTLLVSVDNFDNWVPMSYRNVHVDAFDVGTQERIGSGDSGDLILQGRSPKLNIQLPLSVAYTSKSGNDKVLQNLINACGPKQAGKPPPELNLRLVLTFDVWVVSSFGIHYVVEDPGTNVLCPP
ncbi:uncharacterized protein VTP21DRAFT_11536 [Calcarisporiella thermophila]|uniref:uncharacterized protein n=1 Tax=Calcarisporiella thermophila TaxID=911321 RepID=UPI003742C34D